MKMSDPVQPNDTPMQDVAPRESPLPLPSRELRELAERLVTTYDYAERLQIVARLHELADALEGTARRASQIKDGSGSCVEIPELGVSISTFYVRPEGRDWFAEVFVNIVRRAYEDARYKTAQDYRQALRQLVGLPRG